MTSVGNVVTTPYLYDVNEEQIAEGANGATTTYPFPLYNVQGATTTKHLSGNSEDIADVHGSGTSAKVYYIHEDALGGTNVVSNASLSGTVSQVIEYYPFGSTRLDDQTVSFGEQRHFTGHELDTVTGLNYMNARYQDPARGSSFPKTQASMTLERPTSQVKCRRVHPLQTPTSLA